MNEYYLFGAPNPLARKHTIMRHFEGVSEEMNKESGGWRVTNLIESVYMYGNDNAKGTNLKTKNNIRIQQIKYEYECSDFAGTNK